MGNHQWQDSVPESIYRRVTRMHAYLQKWCNKLSL